MDLGIFSFVDAVLERLEEMRLDLDIASRELESFFERELEGKHEGYLNINTRVKSSKSLKEKILRYDYYNKYQTADAMYEDLSDLIGVRLECRFIDDEIAIYKFLKQHFRKPDDTYRGFYYSSISPQVMLELDSKQPKNQKNGVRMYRIDGKYRYNDQCINFELQIKSLVNIFWSEIEHKIIYKNYNYIIADKFYKDIMKSIKNSLTTIDQQLLLISNEFERKEKNTGAVRKEQLEKLLSKVVYDIFANNMKSSIGILVDFRKSCDSIVKYVFRERGAGESDDMPLILTNAFNRLSEIEDRPINFNTKLTFERELVFEDTFSETIGLFIKGEINKEFQWNLFFRILFEIEPEDNASDFEKFIAFYRDRIYNNLQLKWLRKNFSEEEGQQILASLMERYAVLFMSINSVEVLYDNAVIRITNIVNTILETIYRNIDTYEEWESEKEIYLQLFAFRVLSIFDIDVEATQVLDLLEDVRKSESNIEIHKSILKYIDKL